MDAKEAAERAAVVAAARAWAGTPFHDGAAVKGVGIDCAQLVRAAAIESGVRPDIAPTGAYGSQWMLHKDDERLIEFVLRYGREIFPAEADIGDLVAYRVGRAFAHLALISVRGARIVHAHKSSGFVIESALDVYDLKDVARRYFSFWG